MPDVSDERRLALEQATYLHSDRYSRGGSDDFDIIATASTLFGFLAGPIAFHLTIGPVVDQTTGVPTGTIVGGSMAQLRDSEQFTLSVQVASAKGSYIPDTPGIEDDVSWSTADDGVVSLEVSDDSRSCTVIAGSAGSTVVTVALGELSATLAVDVIPGDAAKLTITEGAVTPQPGV